MQETQVWSFVQDDSTDREAIKPMHHNYWDCALEPGNCNDWAYRLLLPKPAGPGACAPEQKPAQWGTRLPQQSSKACHN